MPEFFTTTAGALTLIAGSLLAFGVIWQKAIKPVVKGVDRLVTAIPVLDDIAKAFKPNGKPSLQQTVQDIEAATVDAKKLAKAAADAAREAHEVAVRASDRIEEIVTTTREEFAYIHDRNHDIMNALTVIQGTVVLTHKQSERHREDFPQPNEGGTS